MAISVMTWVWNHSRSRHGARLVLLAIADCASGDGGNAWPSNAELRRKSGLGERAVQSGIAELVKLGELEVGRNLGPSGCNRYQVVMSDPRNICTPAESAPPQILRGAKGTAGKSSQVKAQDPAESAPPQILQVPPQNLHPTPAESAPVTVLEPTTNQKQKDIVPATPPRRRDLDRTDVHRICEHLAERIAANGSKRPVVTRKWLDAARLMLDADGRTEEEVRGAIEWSQADEFWRGNILSMPKLREKYDQLRMQAMRSRKSSSRQPDDADYNELRRIARALDEQEAAR